VKIFLHTTQAEQDKRLEERIRTPWKRWKTGTDDYHNRSQRAAYVEAYEDMFRLCSPPSAPWHVVAANDKKWARVRSLELICEALGAGVDLSWPEPDAELVKIAEKALGKKLD
jgi:polyphosphate kinase 2 (PPK2 family)